MNTSQVDLPRSSACHAERRRFGTLADGRQVDAITLSNPAGMRVCLIAWGAAIQSLWAPDRHARFADVIAGYSTLDGYLVGRDCFGATLGRVANRIARGRFVLDGTLFQIPPNDGDNALHGGPAGFDQVLWDVLEVSSGADTASVRFGHLSADGDQGFPGTLTTTATYTLDAANALSIHYHATTDRATVVNLSNHAYWNLAGDSAARSALGHELTLPAGDYLPVDAGLIPSGAFRPVAGTAFDFREPVRIDARIHDDDEQLLIGHGYDHCWVIARERGGTVRPVARLYDPGSGRVLEIRSDQPGIQFYSGNFLGGDVPGKHGRCYRAGDAVALEPQMFPDTPNQPAFDSIRLDPGQDYHCRIVFAFSACQGAPPRQVGLPHRD